MASRIKINLIDFDTDTNHVSVDSDIGMAETANVEDAFGGIVHSPNCHCVDLILKLRNTIKTLKKRIIQKNQTIRRLNIQHKRELAKHAGNQKNNSSGMEIERKSGLKHAKLASVVNADDRCHRRKLTMMGMIAVAIRRNMSNIATADFGLATCCCL